MWKTARFERLSIPTNSAGCRLPSGSTTVIRVASVTARAVVTTMPPASTTSPMTVATCPVRTTRKTTVEGRTLATTLSTWSPLRTFTGPGSVVGALRTRESEVVTAFVGS